MVELSAPRAPNPADRTVVGQAPDNRSRTSASLSFASLLRGPAVGPFPAHGPAALPNRSIAPQTGADGASGGHHAHARRDSAAARDPESKAVSEKLLDPFFCQLAVNQGLSSHVQANTGACSASPALPLREDLQNLLTGLVRRAAWGGDRRKGTARIELSEGSLAGATLVVHAEQRSVSVELELPPGMATQGWQQRIAARLEARGFAARVKVG